jgi:hypothetical protein
VFALANCRMCAVGHSLLLQRARWHTSCSLFPSCVASVLRVLPLWLLLWPGLVEILCVCPGLLMLASMIHRWATIRGISFPVTSALSRVLVCTDFQNYAGRTHANIGFRTVLPLRSNVLSLSVFFFVLPGLPLHRDNQKRLVLKPWVHRACKNR